MNSIDEGENSLNNDLRDDLGKDLNTLSVKKTSMPKLVLPVEGENSSSSDQYDQNNKAVDSNKAIVAAYYVRKLLTKSV